MEKIVRSLALGHTALEAHEQSCVIPLVSLNYVNPDHRLPLPFPKGDWYLSGTAVAASRSGEIIVTPTLIPGLREYYRQIGLLSNDTILLEVEPQPDSSGRMGFPYTDVLEIFSRNLEITDDTNDICLTPTFTNEHTIQQAQRMGISSLPRPDSFITNNKATLRLSAERYGINMARGKVVQPEDSLVSLVEEFKSSPNGIWVKSPTGSGGDLVQHVKVVAKESLQEAIAVIRQSIGEALQKGSFRVQLEELWPEDRLSPSELPLVIEEDVKNYGTVIANGSTQFVTHKNRETNLVGHFLQMTTDEGEYLGNKPFYSSESTERLILDQVSRVAEFNKIENGYFGNQGTDWFLVQTNEGIKVFIVELNARNTANTPPTIIANKLGLRNWVNINAYTQRPMRTIEDYIALVGEDLAFGDGNLGIVVPQAFRTMSTRRAVVTSPNFKVFIGGSCDDHCDRIMQRLQERGIRFIP